MSGVKFSKATDVVKETTVISVIVIAGLQQKFILWNVKYRLPYTLILF